MKPSRISIAVLVVSLVFAPALFAQAPASENQGVAAPGAAAPTAEVPRLIKFSGSLLDEEGQALAGPVGVTFALYARQTDGAALWLETQNVKPDGNGNYTVLLGANSVHGLPAELFTSAEARWLGMQVEHQPEQPRVLLVSVPYALKASDADTLGGLPPSAFAQARANPTASSSAASANALLLPSSAPSATSLNTSTDPNVTTAGGTINFIAKFDSPSDVKISQIFDNGSNVGIGFPVTPTPAPVSKLDINGGVNVRGTLQLPATGAANSTTKGFNSQPFDYLASVFNGTAALNQHFRWQVEPVNPGLRTASGKLNLLFASGTGTPAETGLSVSNKGVLTFAPGQEFSGNGASLTNVNAAQLGGVAATGYAKLARANTFTQPQSIKGGASGNLLSVQGTGTGAGSFTVDASGNITNSGVIVAGNDINTSGFLFSNGLDSTGLATLQNGLSVSGNTSFSGRVGIGTTTPIAQLQANGSANTVGIEAKGGDAAGNSSAGVAIFATGGNSSIDGQFAGDGIVAFGGNVTAGSFLGGVGIQARGGTDATGATSLAGLFQGDIEVDGCVMANGANLGTTCPSDARFKKDIQAFPSVLDRVVQLQPVFYNWRIEAYPRFHFPSGRVSGLIAQDVEKVLPDMVSTDEAGYKRVNYGELPYLMLQAIRELKAESDNLKAENDNLRERIQRLEAAATPTP